MYKVAVRTCAQQMWLMQSARSLLTLLTRPPAPLPLPSAGGRCSAAQGADTTPSGTQPLRMPLHPQTRHLQRQGRSRQAWLSLGSYYACSTHPQACSS